MGPLRTCSTDAGAATDPGGDADRAAQVADLPAGVDQKRAGGIAADVDPVRVGPGRARAGDGDGTDGVDADLDDVPAHVAAGVDVDDAARAVADRHDAGNSPGRIRTGDVDLSELDGVNARIAPHRGLHRRQPSAPEEGEARAGVR